MDNELNGDNLGCELNLCLINPGRNTLVVLPDADTVYSFVCAFANEYKSNDFKVSVAGILFKNGSCIRIVTKTDETDALIENGSYNCVLFEQSLVESEADISDLDNFMKAFL